MEITFTYEKSENVIYTKCPEEITNENMMMYFNKLISMKDEIKNAHEVVDFTSVKSFKPTYNEFKKIKYLYEKLVSEGAIKKTTFKTSNAHQNAMSRVYGVSVYASDAEKEFEYICEENKLRQ